MSQLNLDTAVIDQLKGVEKKKYLLKIRILKALFVNGPQTVSWICKNVKVSSPNAMSILNEMLARNIIEKKGFGKSIGGRKPDLYGFVSTSLFIVAIELSVYQMRISIFNAINEQVVEAEEYSLYLDNNESTLDTIIDRTNSLINKTKIDHKKLLGIGISMPGLVDSEKGVNYTFLNYNNRPITEIIQNKIGCPVFIENDAKAMALAEHILGSAKGVNDFLLLFIDMGVGLGMVLNGKLYRGAMGFAGEFSHIPIVEDGKLCECGKLGCLQTVASGINIISMVEEGVQQGITSIQLDDVDKTSKYKELIKVINAAVEGDQYAIRILDETGKILGKGISTLIQLFNPKSIVLSGILSESGDLITNPIKQGINTHAMKQISEHVKIEISKFGKELGLYGALAIVMDKIFEEYIK
ncbi:ROK family protein [Carboxylicivirga linearis]|uniref:ROK family transcriptional regulator n=1 Tax=Carboxylicivirga linearis TaxID=1628157 RepID=A0ABS5JYE9_9BACT|nr:ROK family transcriptional regulator [Carboxylicivirga linearis]MBS2099883.1 ROK family transcriptional regulator [Carboxylicivirga linearis]